MPENEWCSQIYLHLFAQRFCKLSTLVPKARYLRTITKKALYVLNDLALVSVSVLVPIWVLNIALEGLSSVEKALLVSSPLFAVLVFYWQGLYETVIRYLSFKAVFTVSKSVCIFGLLLAIAIWVFASGLPGSLAFLVWLVSLLLIGASRLLRSWQFAYYGNGYGANKDKKNVLIYGAGTAGVQLATLLSYGNRHIPMGFVDDSPSLRDRVVEGHRVYALEEIQQLIDKLKIDEILLAIPSASRSRRKRILKTLEPFRVHVRSLPSLEEIVNCEVKIDDIREVDMMDLLGRDQVPADDKLLKVPITGKVVMVTGAAGSIGSELCRQIVKHGPACLVLYEQHEFSLYTLANALEDSGEKIVPVLGSVTDSARLGKTLNLYKVDTIYHAAAYKHVPMVEANPSMGVFNNVCGTYAVAKAACESRVESFVLISTDKAVRPTNVMGATKRVAELIIQALDKECEDTQFCAVRFGNVIGSSGSVIPLFRGQIKNGGPITVTDSEVTRFFMTVPEAAQLVIQAGALNRGGDIFVLDMGKPVRIDEMARHMVRLSGLEVMDENNPSGDIEIKYTGLRPGEKLYEELLIDGDTSTTQHSRIMCANEDSMSISQIEAVIASLETAVQQDGAESVTKILSAAVEGYEPK